MASSSPSPPFPMLSIPEKKPLAADLYSAVRRHISVHFSDREAQLYDQDIRDLHTLRSDLLPALSVADRRDRLLRYCRALSAALPRFASLSLAVSWHDAFRPSKKATGQGLALDRAASLLALAAAYSEAAATEDRRGEEGRKAACGGFQAAAGVLGFLRGRACAEVKGAVTVDLTPECVGMLERLMLAQAQECFFEKVIADGKAHGIGSKVAMQVSLYYEEVNSSLSSPQLSQHLDKTWMGHVQLKAALFHAEACYRAGLDLYEKERVGEQIARLKDGIKKLSKVKKSVKGAPTPLLDAANKLEVLMNSNLTKAMKENDQIYILRIPEPESLDPLPGVSLVKPTVMDELLDGSKEKSFAGLVPDASAKALSRYTEMVDGIIRTQAEKLQQESEIARVKLKEMDLPDSILALEGHVCLPVNLKQILENNVQAAAGTSALESNMRELSDLNTSVQTLLVQMDEMLEKEEEDDNRFRTQFGTRWTRPPSKTLTKNLQDRLSKLAATVRSAAGRDAEIYKSIEDNSELLVVLDSKPIESAIPSLAKPMMSLDGREDAIIGSLKLSLRQLEALGSQRASLEDMLKEMKRKDDILPKLMSTSGSHEDLFTKELSKYDPICADIVQNIDAQQKLLLEIQVQNKEFSVVLNLEDYKVQRERCYNRIADAVMKFKDIKSRINDAFEFYITLREEATALKQQCDDFIKKRSKECQATIQEVQDKIATLDISFHQRTGYNYPTGQPTSVLPQSSSLSEQPYQSCVQVPQSEQPNQHEEQWEQYNPAVALEQPPTQEEQHRLSYFSPPQQPKISDGRPNQSYQSTPPPTPYQPTAPSLQQNGPYQPPYQQTPPSLHPNGSTYQPYQSTPSNQHFNPPGGHPYNPVPQQSNPSTGGHQPFHPMPPPQYHRSWNVAPPRPFPQPQPPPYHQPHMDQQYPPPYSPYSSVSQPPYTPLPGYSYQPPPTRPYQPPPRYPEYGRPEWGTPNYASPPYLSAPPPYSNTYSNREQYPTHLGSYHRPLQ